MTEGSDRVVLVMRADAGPEIGLGHAMRCLALAEWRSADDVAVLVSRRLPRELRERAKASGVELVEVDAASSDTSILMREVAAHDSPWVVLDGYHLDPTLPSQVRAAGTLARTLALDDRNTVRWQDPDLVLDQNPDVPPDLYGRALLGPEFALLRREFRAWQDWGRRTGPQIERVLITLGGGDTASMASTLASATQSALPEAEVTVVLGPAVASPDGFGDRTRVLRAPHDLPSLMAECDVSVTAAGTTCWELAFMMVPMVVIPLSPNHAENVKALVAAGVAVATEAGGVAAAVGALSPADRVAMSVSGRTLIDGLGGSRVMAALRAPR